MADLHAHLAAATGFQWDEGNATKNWAKHEVSQAECEQLFFNAPLVLAADPEHSGGKRGTSPWGRPTRAGCSWRSSPCGAP